MFVVRPLWPAAQTDVFIKGWADGCADERFRAKFLRRDRAAIAISETP